MSRRLPLALAAAVAACASPPADAGPPPRVVAEPRALALVAGSSSAVGAGVTGAADASRLEWRSLAPDVADVVRVTPPSAGGVVVVALKPGSARMVVRLADRPEVADTVAVTVLPYTCPLPGPTVRPDRLDLAVGASRRLEVAFGFCGPTPVDTTPAWRSLHPEVAAVDSTGLVTGVAPGVATIRVAPRGAPNVVGVATVTVR